MHTNKVFIETFGCQMNEHDSRQLGQLLINNDYQIIETQNLADIILVNTCSVRSGPENKVRSLVGRLKKFKKTKPNLIIGIGGCVAQQEKEKFLAKDKVVDFVFGPDNINKVPELINQAKVGQRLVATDWDKTALENTTHNLAKPQNGQAYIAITKGCDNFCSYCIVPFTRGRELSRSLDSILDEAKILINQGAKEITLVGQNVNSYSSGNDNFYTLLDKLSLLNGLKRLRFISPHPKDWNNELTDLMAEREVICNQLHLPFQAGSSRILKLMRRDHDIENYLQKINYIKTKIPNISLSTDIIVGFPTETNAEYLQTIDVLKQVEFDQVYAFKYTPRPGTKAAKLEDDISFEEKSDRLNNLFAEQAKIKSNKLTKLVKTKQNILVTLVNSNQSSGKIEANHTVYVNTQLNLGEIYSVVVESANSNSLNAILA